jgi:hypothetical protein
MLTKPERYIIAVLIFAFVWGCFMWVVTPEPVPFQLPDLTPQELKVYHKAKKKFGDYPVERLDVGDMVMILPNGTRKL